MAVFSPQFRSCSIYFVATDLCVAESLLYSCKYSLAGSVPQACKGCCKIHNLLLHNGYSEVYAFYPLPLSYH